MDNQILNYFIHKIIFSIIGNKCDLYIKEKVDENEILCKY